MAGAPPMTTAPLALDPTPSNFARVGALVYALLIVYASWYPFANWHVSGLSPLGFISAPLPHYWTAFDLGVNVLGYLPFGLLLVCALYPRLRGGAAFTVALTVGVLLSGLMEAVQTFLPSRVPSNLDLLTNSTGALLGAGLGWVLTPALLEQSRFVRWRQRWFVRDAGRGLIVLALWPLAQLYPQAYLFGHGQVVPMITDWLADWLPIGMQDSLSLWLAEQAQSNDPALDVSALLRHGVEISVQQYWLAETLISACGMAGALLTLAYLLRERAPKIPLLLGLLIITLALKALASALLFAPENAFVWVTPGAQGGLLLGLMLLVGLLFLRPVVQRRVAALLLMLNLLIVNIAPANPYFVATLQAWVQGKFLNFNGAAQFLALVWPLLMLWFLFHPAHRQLNDSSLTDQP